MDRKWIIASIVAVAVGIAAAPFFLPKDTVELDQAAPPGSGDAMGDMKEDGDGAMMEDDGMESPKMAMPDRSATWMDGDSRHSASGTVTITVIDDTHYLHFEDFELTAGPDVYIYLTRSADPKSTADVEGDGIRIDAVTDADPDARINERGTFFLPLDMDAEALAEYDGIVAWCDDFNVIFGTGAFT